MANSPIAGMDSGTMMERLRAGIDSARKVKKMTRMEVADKAGTSRDQFYKFMRGETSAIPADAALKIAAALGTNLSSLISMQRSKVYEIVDCLSELPPDLQEIALRHIQVYREHAAARQQQEDEPNEERLPAELRRVSKPQK